MRMRHGGSNVMWQLGELCAVPTILVFLEFALVVGATAEGATIQLSASRAAGEAVTATLEPGDGEITPTPEGTLRWKGSWEEDNWAVEWDVELDDDPGVGVHSLNVANGGAATGTFTFEVSIPSAVELPLGSPITGSSSVSIADANASGAATLSAPTGESIYTAKIASVEQMTLFNGAYSLDAPANGTSSDNASDSGVSTVGIGINNPIAIRHFMTVTAGDAATANSTFFVVPEPAGAGLALITVAGCWLWRRRVSG